jgi:hypothetical protein
MNLPKPGSLWKRNAAFPEFGVAGGTVVVVRQVVIDEGGTMVNYKVQHANLENAAIGGGFIDVRQRDAFIEDFLAWYDPVEPPTETPA